MLKHNRIHGDLSAYNILYWNRAITLIDFPQVVLPESNPASWNIFLRDVTRVCEYFSSQGLHCNGHKLAAELWTAHGHKIIQEVDPRYLDAEKPEDRQVWEKQR
jgi:serine/threonine-protein kinase RIO1